MKCLDCNKPSLIDRDLCAQCASKLNEEVVSILDRASKEVVAAYQLEITKNGILVLLSDKALTYMKLDTSEWDAFKAYLTSTNFSPEDDYE